jgi:hypothetical protein
LFKVIGESDFETELVLGESRIYQFS